MSAQRRVYITTPIYYVNDVPHIGHTYTTVVADALARYHRLRGDAVHFLTGTDEHGQKMQRAAEARGMTPIELADEVVENYKRTWPALGISHDDFIRTTEPRHKDGVYALFDAIRRNDPDALYKGEYEGLYCTGCESYYAANQVRDGRCPDQGHPVETVAEESWFFRLSAFGDRLLELYDARPEFVLPGTRRNEVRGFVAEGLRDLSISRTREKVSWGLPFPGDESHVIYVWFDALTNYISALGYGSGDDALYRDYWEGDALRLHLIGKDIVRFHAVYWPAFLMAAGLPLPTTVFAHGWWLQDEAKMSKTRGNVVRPGELLNDFGPDATRWFLLREISLGLDGNFSDEAVIERTNADLSNNVGNLFSRVTALIARQGDGAVPRAEPLADEELGATEADTRARYGEAFERHDPGAALRAVTDHADAVNRFLVRHEPWRREGREETCARALRTAAGELALIAVRLLPAMPRAAARMLGLLGLPEETRALRELAGQDDLLGVAAWPVEGRAVSPGASLFPRLDRKTILGERAETATEKPQRGRKRAKQAAAPASEPAAGETQMTIGIDDFRKVTLRTARVVAAEKHPDADRLLRIEVDLGGETRQIVAGIASAYAPEDLVGRTVVVVANLAPAKLRGLVSEGMLLAATDADGTPRLLNVDGEIDPGSEVS